MQTFLLNLASTLAHSVVFFTREEWPHCEAVVCEDPSAPNTTSSMRKTMNAVNQQLPGFNQLVSSLLMPTAQAEMNVLGGIMPQYNELMTQMAEQFLPRLAAADSAANLAGAQGDLNIARGPGTQLTQTAQQLDRQLNPEYYDTRALASSKLGELLNSINLNDANPEAERFISQEAMRSGNLHTPSATGTVANALQFGQHAQDRRNALGQALGAASQFMPGAQGQFNLVQTSLGRPSGSQAQSLFGTGSGGQAAFGQGSQMLDTAANMRMQQNQINAQRRDWIDRVNEGTQAVGSLTDGL